MARIKIYVQNNFWQLIVSQLKNVCRSCKIILKPWPSLVSCNTVAKMKGKGQSIFVHKLIDFHNKKFFDSDQT